MQGGDSRLHLILWASLLKMHLFDFRCVTEQLCSIMYLCSSLYLAEILKLFSTLTENGTRKQDFKHFGSCFS